MQKSIRKNIKQIIIIDNILIFIDYLLLKNNNKYKKREIDS